MRLMGVRDGEDTRREQVQWTRPSCVSLGVDPAEPPPSRDRFRSLTNSFFVFKAIFIDFSL